MTLFPPCLRASVVNFPRRLHHDQRGAIGVLVLLTIWCLVGLIAMLWNTADYAVRRQKVQNAADAIAYAGALQTARTLNETTAQNMLIAQDASADIIYRAATDTVGSINTELTNELAALTALEGQQKQLASRIPGMEKRIDDAYIALQSALGLVQEDLDAGGMTFKTDKDATIYKNKVRQAAYAANWVYTVYYNELKGLAQQAANVTLTDQMIQEAKDTIGDTAQPTAGTEYGIWQTFEEQIAPASNTTAIMQAHELDLFKDQQELVTAAQDAQQAQTTALAKYHNVLASDGSPPPVLSPLLSSTPPVVPASTIEPTYTHVDSISGLTVTLDPINPNTGDAEISHPPEVILFNELPTPVTVGFNTPGGWGHCFMFPLERYLQARVTGDSVQLRQDFMIPIDNLRQAMALKWAQELSITINVPALPNSIPDPQVDPITKQPTTINILPDLTNPNAAGGKTDPDFAYRRASASFLGAIRTLENALRNYAGLYNRYTAPYAVPSYNGHLAAERAEVAAEVGGLKNFSVLGSYNLYPIPPWARSGIHDSLVRAIKWQLYQRSMGWGYHPIDECYNKIDPYVQQIADEMVSRPWPYEKAPPQVPVPPTFGMGKLDRQNYFSTFTVIANQPDGHRGVMFPRLFGDSPPFVAYAQAEALNWMEYNESYGDYYTEKFDEVSLNTLNSLMACPRAWRLASTGGWNWRARLAPADIIPRLLNKNDKKLYNPDVAEAFTNANITNANITDGQLNDFDIINLH